MSRYRSVCVYAVLTMLVASQSMADIVTYSDRATFNAAITDATTLNFDGLAVANSYAEVSPPYTSGEVTITGGSPIYALNDASWGTGFTGGKQVFCLAPAGNTATPVAGRTAVGVDLYHFVATGYGVKERLTVNFSDSTSQSIEVNFGSMVQNEKLFMGVTSTNPVVTISSVVFVAQDPSNGYQTPIIDNLTYGKAVPEPSSSVLLAMGIFGLVCYAWKKRN